SAITGLALQSDGRIVAAGASTIDQTGRFAVARYNADGSLDDDGSTDSTPGDSFGIGGKVVTPFASQSKAAAFRVAILPHGGIVAAGYAELEGTYHFALACYTSPTVASTGTLIPMAESLPNSPKPARLPGASLFNPMERSS